MTSTTHNVLIVDDSSTIRAGIRIVLQQARLFDSYFDCPDGESALVLLEQAPMEVVLCDIIMPGMDGFEFLRQMKSKERFRDIPVILLTGQEQVKKKIIGLELGAADYLTKPFDPGELIARVRVQQKMKRLQDELKVAKQKYLELSITDFLTQITNRRHFMEMFLKEFSRARRNGQNLAMMMFDIDHFKNINDRLGHLQGDSVLRELAALIKAQIRQYDSFARYGGEEFILMLPETTPEGAFAAAEKLRGMVEEQTFEGMDAPGSVTVSVGVGCFPEDRIRTGEELIHVTDKALYSAKANGRNRVERARSFDTAEYIAMKGEVAGVRLNGELDKPPVDPPE